jgi:uncharacterized SAM-binding protein YcdF (DUF218 family)
MYHFFVWEFLQPYFLLCLTLGIGLVTVWIIRKDARPSLRWVILLYLVLIGLSLPATSWLCLGSLEWRSPPLQERPSDVQAIVILSGGVRGPDEVLLRPELSGEALARCVEAARLYHQGRPCPVLCSGRVVESDYAERAATAATQELLADLGVARSDILTEDQSRTTYENARESTRVLESRGIRKIALISSSIHLLRAERCFQRLDVEVVSSGCDYRATRFKPTISKFIPSAESITHIGHVCHEWIGFAWYWLLGRI